MTYLALARKWRPKRFDQIVGQPHVVQALSHALTHQKIHHAYLFTGTHGTGKTTTARIFAKCLNCETGITATPCEKCANCLAIDAGRFPDLFEIDAASRTKVEDTRDLLDNIPYAPTQGRYKIYLIDEVHMLSNHSFNALLKTLEEPPSHVLFLLATTDPQKLPATVLSRCLQFHLSLIIPKEIETQLSAILQTEKIAFEQNALTLIAESAHGSMRDSLSLLDQCIAYSNGNVTLAETETMLGLANQTDITTLLTAIHSNDAEKALSLTQQWAAKGVNFSRCLSELLKHLYHLSIAQLTNPSKKTDFSREDVQLYYQIASMGQNDLPLAPTAQIGFEMIVMRMMAFTINTQTKHAERTVETRVELGTKSATSVQNPTQSNWNTLLNQLKLTGPTLALAQHCTLRKLTDDQLQLTLQSKYAALINEKQRQRIQDAATQYFNKKIHVTMSVDENALETPAVSAQRLQEAQQQSAKKVISTDQTVQRIVNTFGATVVEDSIEPLN